MTASVCKAPKVTTGPFPELDADEASALLQMCRPSTDFTTFVNLRWYLDVANKKTSAHYMLNGLAMFVGWLFARIILFIYFFYHIYTHFDQTIESSLHDTSGPVRSLLASLSLVDLAGSERAVQTNSLDNADVSH